MSWTLIASYGNELDVLLAKGALENEDIECRVKLSEQGDALLGGFGLQNGPSNLFVEAKDLEKAKNILKI